jgi:GTP cyclohydrolase I
MQDVQNHRDDRELPIDRVGVCDLRYPITVMDRENRQQSTTARLSMSVSLPHDFKGTHMSRFIEVLNSHRGEITMRTLPTILRELKQRLDAETAHIEVEFSYFLERCAPVSGARALMDYECSFTGEVNGGTSDFILGVRVPVTSLCPCSKAISAYGAHNQRGYISIEIRSRPGPGPDLNPELVWIEEVVEMAEASSSAPLYPLLKREDERHVTMQAYDNPAFVEDIVREVALRLKKDERIVWFRVHALNQESIHNHNAFAQIAWSRH